MIKQDFDSDGNTYQIMKQQQESSCGIASVWMAKCLVQRKSVNDEEWGFAQGVYAAIVGQTLEAVKQANKNIGPQSFDATKFAPNATSLPNAVSSGGFSASQLADGLRGQGMSVEESIPVANGTPFVPSKLGDGRPAVVLLKWEKNGAGHFVVAVRQSSYGTIVFLDPLEGKVNERPNVTRYRGRSGGVGQILAVMYLS